MTCKHCGEGICDNCWKKRADLLIERDDLKAENRMLQSKLREAERRIKELEAAMHGWHDDGLTDG